MRSCILKVTSFCNLNCTYCYMFNLEDRSYLRAPKMMSVETAFAAIDLIRGAMRDAGHHQFDVVLHGGEPTLWPERHTRALLEYIAAGNRPNSRIAVGVQTNAFRPLSRDMLQLFRDHDVRLGVSVDGPRPMHDARRIDHRGRGSYDRVMANVRALLDAGFGDLLGGFLCVAAPEFAPAAFLAWAQELPIRRLDVLWPIQHTVDSPPWAGGDPEAYRAAPRHGRWMAELFELWWELDDPSLYIRSFYEAIHLTLGGRSHHDFFVNDRIDMFVVNTDGHIEYPDYLRAAADGGVDSGLRVGKAGPADLARQPVFARLRALSDELPPACADCRHRRICGGGFLPGRTSRTELLVARPSVLCADQSYFFDTVSARVGSRRAAEVHHDAA